MSDLGDKLNDILGSYNQKLSSVLPKAVGSNAVLMAGISLMTILLFNLLRPRNKIVYEPKTKYHVGNKKPPKIQDGFFSWLSPLIHTKEPELLDKIGLDAVSFLRFLRMLRWLFLAISALTCAVLIPANIVYNNKHVPAEQKNVLSILTIQNLRGNILFLHVGVSYLITFIVMGFVWFNWKAMLALRHAWFRSDEYTKSFYARTLMVLRVPKKLQSDEGLVSLFQQMQVPYPTTSVHIGRRVGQLPELIEYHNNTVRSFEQVLVRYLKGGKIGKKRPTITVGGFLGFGGTKKDSIDFYTNKLEKTETKIEEIRSRIDDRKPESYGFASMAAVPYAHVVAKMLENKSPKGTIISLAPNPKDLIWKNLTMSDSERTRSNLLGWLFLALVCFFNTIPLLIISALANLANIAEYVTFLQDWRDQSEWSFALVSGVLPPIVMALFGFILPMVMRWLSQYQGAITHSRLDRAVVARYFAFLIISQLLIFSLLGVGFNIVTKVSQKVKDKISFKEIIESLHIEGLPDEIQSTYIGQAPYWLTFFPLRGFLAIFDLAQLINLVWTSIKTRLFGRTPRDIREWTQPPDFEYAVYYGNLLFMSAVALIYAPLAPLVAVAAMIVFWVSSVVYKYQLMFVFVSSVESGGRLWNVVINRLLISVVFMQLLMILTIGLQHGWSTYLWVSAVPPVFFILVFKIYCSRTFMRPFRYYIPSESEIANAEVHSQRADHSGNKLEKRFGHPAWQAEIFTPLLHAKMMPLLPQVYHGRLGQEKTAVNEYGQKLDTSITPSGLRIAAVEESDLEYDPALYGRDRGELNWDTRSRASTHLFGNEVASLHHSKSGFYASSGTGNRPAGYEQYLTHGAGSRKGSRGNDLEMARFDSQADILPLLNAGDPMARSRSPSIAASAHLDNGQHSRGRNTPLPYYDGPPGYSSEALIQPNNSGYFGQSNNGQIPPMRRSSTDLLSSDQPMTTQPTHRPHTPSRSGTLDMYGSSQAAHHPRAPSRSGTLDMYATSQPTHRPHAPSRSGTLDMYGSSQPGHRPHTPSRSGTLDMYGPPQAQQQQGQYPPSRHQTPSPYGSQVNMAGRGARGGYGPSY